MATKTQLAKKIAKMILASEPTTPTNPVIAQNAEIIFNPRGLKKQLITKYAKAYPEQLKLHTFCDSVVQKVWEYVRMAGIGGSDSSVCLNCNPYRVMLELFFNKLGKLPRNVRKKSSQIVKRKLRRELRKGKYRIIDNPLQFQLAWGHALEDTIAREVARKMGVDLINDQNMYRSKAYPFMCANLDRLIRFRRDGRIAILEIKTANPETRWKWEDDSVPYYYYIQVIHYMIVTGIREAYIACAFDNNPQNIVIRKVEYDEDMAASIIEADRKFWEEHVLKRIPPTLAGEAPDIAMETLRKFYAAKPNITPVSLDGFKNELEKIEKLRDAKSRLEKEVKSLDEQIKVLQIPILDHLGENTSGATVIGNKSYELTYKAQSRTGVSNQDLEKMAYSDPDAYKKYVKETATRVARFSVKAVTPKK